MVYSPLGNNKYKGSAQTIKGNIEINSSKILLTEGNVPRFQFPVIAIRFLCKGEFICTAEGYLRNQKKYLNAREKEWLENHFTNFFNSNRNVKMAQCGVIIATNAEFNISEGVIICSTSGQGEHIRAAITTCNSEALSKLQDNHPTLKQIPISPLLTSFEVEIVAAAKSDDIKKAQSTKTKIKNYINGIRYANINEFIIEYKEIFDPTTFKMNTVYALDENSVAPAMTKKKIDPVCCIKANSDANVIFICLLTKKRCVHDKAALYTSMTKGISNVLKKGRKKQEIKKMAEGQNKFTKNLLDLFDFGLKVDYRKFP
ncbi:MAG: hypothetical protein GY861_27360 [bacterium]|nr:hypothetical protein [bacterium]